MEEAMHSKIVPADKDFKVLNRFSNCNAWLESWVFLYFNWYFCFLFLSHFHFTVFPSSKYWKILNKSLSLPIFNFRPFFYVIVHIGNGWNCKWFKLKRSCFVNIIIENHTVFFVSLFVSRWPKTSWILIMHGNKSKPFYQMKWKDRFWKLWIFVRRKLK